MAASTPAETKSVMSGPVMGPVKGSVTISDTITGDTITDDSGKAFASDVQSGGPDDSQNFGSCCDGPCCPTGRFWVEADYLLWWTKGSHLPALVTTSGTDLSTPPGSLGRADTVVLFGDSTVENGNRSGYDLTLGMWLNCCNTWGIEGNYFDLGRQSASFENCLSNGYPVLAGLFTTPAPANKTRRLWPIRASSAAG